MKRILCCVCLPLFLSSFLLSQSLAELAKKERERREKLKGKKSILITNADLVRLRRSPAVSTSRTITGQQKSRRSIPSKEKLSQTEPPSRELEGVDKMEFRNPKKDLEAKLREAIESAELLSFKMNSLWQEYHSNSDKNIKERIQSKIHQTSQKLAKARKDEEETRKELERQRKRNDS